MDKTRGEIITFYSYKGGTGRTMALANVACLLAADRRVRGGVLMIDWDLEAPGLHRFFHEDGAAAGTGIRRTEEPADTRPGLIELLYDLDRAVDRLVAPQTGEKPIDIESTVPARSFNPPAPDGAVQGAQYAGTTVSGNPAPLVGEALAREAMRSIDLQAYIGPTRVKGLSLMKSGRFGSPDINTYSEMVNRFNWEALYNKCPHLFRILAETLADRYEYVLVDSRTGVTDISGICTTLLPQKLVVVFTPNTQSLKGGIETIRRATEYRKESADLRPLIVFPLVSRVEANEPDLRHDWRFGSADQDTIGYQSALETALAEVYEKKKVDLTAYFDEMQIQQIPRYSYGEQIAVLREKSADKFSLRRSYDTFARSLMTAGLPWEGEIDTRATGPDSPGGLEDLSIWLFTKLRAFLKRPVEVAGFLVIAALLLLAIAGAALSVVEIRRAGEAREQLTAAEQKSAGLQSQLDSMQDPVKLIQEKDKALNDLYKELDQSNTALLSARQDVVKSKTQFASLQSQYNQAVAERQSIQNELTKCQDQVRQQQSRSPAQSARPLLTRKSGLRNQ